jgi:hypothetical protein
MFSICVCGALLGFGQRGLDDANTSMRPALLPNTLTMTARIYPHATTRYSYALSIGSASVDADVPRACSEIKEPTKNGECHIAPTLSLRHVAIRLPGSIIDGLSIAALIGRLYAIHY